LIRVGVSKTRWTLIGAMAVGTAVAVGLLVTDGTEKPARIVPTGAVAPLGYTTIHPGWLPGRSPTAVLAASTANGNQELAYATTVEGTRVDIAITARNGARLPGRSEVPLIPHRLTMDGHPAREWHVGDDYELAYRTADNYVASVRLTIEGAVAPRTATGDLPGIARHVARELRFDAQNPIDVAFVLTDLPPFTHVTRIEASQSGGTRYDITGPASTPQLTRSSSVTAIQPKAASAPATGRNVRGHHSTLTRDDRGDYVLTVPHAHHGLTLTLASGPGMTTRAQLYRVADAVRWTS
jgi:hypothetical protein